MTSIKFRVLAVGMLTALLSLSAFSQASVIYNNIPSPLPGNGFSIAFEANQADQFGDQVFFAGTSRTLTTVVQGLSSWGCESGNWNLGDCVTTPGATFSHPITLNIYNVGAGNEVGTLIGSVTQTFAIPYRPSASPECGDGRWFHAASGSCFNGYATTVTFNLVGLGIVVPNQVIYGIAYNTTHYGNPVMGEGAACYTSSGGCGYDSLNVLITALAPTVGINPFPDDAYFSTETAANYCDAGLGGTDIFRLDAGCWTGAKPTVKFNAGNPATNANQCKNGGWQTRTRADGSTFRNQGDCIQYVNTGR